MRLFLAIGFAASLHAQTALLFEHVTIFDGTGRPAGTIVQVLQPGYVIHDRLLRPAMVGVAKVLPSKEGAKG